MTTVPEDPPVRRKIIGNRLRELREACGMTVNQVAERMGVSRATAYKQETGQTAVSLADVEMYARIYGVEDTPLAEHISTLVIGDRTSRWKKTPKNSKNIKNDGSQIEIAQLEEIADRILHYEPMMIGGLLQSSDYIDALFSTRHMGSSWNRDEANHGISLRRSRQEILYRENRPAMTFIMAESALNYHVGSLDVMLSQAAHLVDLIRVHHIDIRIVPFSSGFVSGMTKPSIMVEIGKSNPVQVAYHDVMRYGHLSDNSDTISLVAEKFTMLMKVSLSPEKTADLLEDYYE